MRKIILGLALVLLAYGFRDESSRDQKLAQLFSSRHPASSGALGKTYPNALAVQIQSDLNTPIPPNTPFVLTAFVSSQTSMPDLHLLWKIPEGARILSGSVEQILNIKAGETLMPSITVSIPDNRNYQIIAVVFRETPDGGHLGHVSQFNTDPFKIGVEHRTVVYPELPQFKPKNAEVRRDGDPSRHKIVQ